MSAIKQALEKLNVVVGELEGSLDSFENAVAKNAVEAAQADMFSSVSNENGTAVDPAFVAQKLDSAIEKVESVLKENQG